MSSDLQELVFNAKDVDGATEDILTKIQFWRSSKVIYFDGWNGFGASAVLRSIAAVLPSRRTIPELCFDKIIYIDCSKWKNIRGVQRAIAEELQLDRSVMAILDEQDEDDDFRGCDESRRNEIDSVRQVIYQTLKGIKFIMIFLNGSDEEVDVGLMGIPLGRYDNHKVMWAFTRSCLTRHQDHFKVVNKLRYTQLFFYCTMKELRSSQFRGLLHQEAATIVARNPCMMDIDPTIVADCCLYELFLHHNFHTFTKFDWVSHASNYWICDAIIQGDRARDISNALHRERNWKCDASLLDHVLKMFMKHSESPFLVIKDDDVYEEGPYRWISVTSRDAEVHGMKTIPVVASSFFLAFEISKHPPTLPDGFFDHCSKLGVLVLCCCAFNFASPPFLKCPGLKFLGLDHCTDDKTIEGEHNTEWLCLYSLWVLDLRYTNWNEILSEEKMDLMTNIRELNIEGVMGWQYIAHLQRQLPNLQKLRIIKTTCRWETSEDVDNYFMDKKSMEILDLSGNHDMKILTPSLSKASSLRLLVLDGCDGLESIGRLPPSLESFSFNGYGPASQWTQTVEIPPKQFRPSSRTDNKDVRISKISLAGCTQLENLFLCWLPNLVELDLSGTAIKILDFETMVVQIPRLKRLFLIGCNYVKSLHVHDVSVRAITPQGRPWRKLRRCCVERCPKVDTVFPGNSFKFTALETFWVSDLLMARSILSKGSRINQYRDTGSFENLQHLHLRSCPRLQFVLPVWVSSFPSLETLHIIHCGNLSHVFILEEEYPEEISTRGVPFPMLTIIHLHDLPKLQQICEVKMVAPMLESIKIRGCWSLRRLPSVGARGDGEKKPAVEIEKDVWDSLEWDAGHRSDHYEAPVHSRYYKEKLPRVSVLR